MEPKVVIKPFNNEDIIDKSRNVTGIQKWARSSPVVGFIMMVMEWLATPLEVFFRRDFGQRWFTPINFYAGLVPIAIFTGIAWLVSALPNILDSLAHSLIPSFQTKSESYVSNTDGLTDMIVWGMTYITMGSYHLFKIKWRNQANIPMHSFDDGTSRLRRPAFVLARILNTLSFPLMAIFYHVLLPAEQRKDKPFPKFISNREAFANTVAEPGAAFAVVLCCRFTVASVWMCLSAFALLIHAQWKEMARRNKILDFQDSKIEAEIMRELKKRSTEEKAEAKPQAAKAAPKKPQLTPQAKVQYPNLSTIIEEMNKGKSHLAN